MVVMKVLCFAAVASVLVSTGAKAETAVATAVAASSDSHFFRVPLARRRPGLRPSRPRSGAAAPTYSLVSVGAPSANSEPAAFNNTGQIVGYGATGCYVYDSGTFQRLPIPSAGTESIDCRLASINDKTAAGTYQIGGTTADPYSSNAAFAVTPRTSIVYYAYGYSALLGVNNNGVSLVSAAFFPVRTTDISGQQYFTGTGGAGYLAQVQAPASSAVPVHYLLPFNDDGGPTCAFGGCLINDLNKILGYDFSSVTPTSVSLAVYTLGNPASLVDLPLGFNATDGFVQSYGPVAFNNHDQILYDASMGAYQAGVPAVYDIDSAKKTVIPLVTQNCPKGGHGDPLSMNNNGEVLGDYYCNNSFFGYFTWDAVTGTHDLSLAIPNTNFTLYPVGVNDSGAILIELLAGGNLVSWGTLDPVISSSAKPKIDSLRPH